MGAPEWYRKKIIKGKTFDGHILGRDTDFLIYSIYADMSERDVITIFIVITQEI